MGVKDVERTRSPRLEATGDPVTTDVPVRLGGSRVLSRAYRFHSTGARSHPAGRCLRSASWGCASAASRRWTASA